MTATQDTEQQPIPSQPAPRKSWFARHKVLTVVGGVVGLSIVGSAIGSSGDDAAPAGDAAVAVDAAAEQDIATDIDQSDGDEKADGTEAADLPGIGDKVRDGKFEFTVTEIEKGVEEVGDQYLNEEAQGQFVLVHLRIENIGDEAQYFDGSSQELIDTKDRTHSADSEAAIYLDDSNSFLNEINPGNKVDGVVVFDIPENAKPETLELHDSAFSGGVSVSLQ